MPARQKRGGPLCCLAPSTGQGLLQPLPDTLKPPLSIVLPLWQFSFPLHQDETTFSPIQNNFFNLYIFGSRIKKIRGETDFGVDKPSGRASRVVLEEINAAGL
jgi:hypothetical protein